MCADQREGSEHHRRDHTRCGKMTGTGATTTGSTTGMIAHWLAQCFEQSRDPASFDNA
jgi:hypothetical protein